MLYMCVCGCMCYTCVCVGVFVYGCMCYTCACVYGCICMGTNPDMHAIDDKSI